MIYFIFAIIVTEALTEIITKSELFFPLRKLLFEKNGKIFKWFHDLLDCGYCTSVWISIFLCTYFFTLNNKYVNIFLIAIVIHRLSNVFHFIVDRINTLKI